MLKAKECYSDEQVYNYQRFMHLATVHAYALDPALQTQVKFIVRNKETTELGINKRNRFVFMDKENRSKFYYRDDAKAMLNTIELARNENVKNYTDILVYRSTEINASLAILIGTHLCDVLNNQYGVGPKNTPHEERLAAGKVRFSIMLDRLESILKQFLEYCQNDLDIENKVPYHFTYGKISTLPLNNFHNGYMQAIILRKIQDSHVSISVRDRSLILYGLSGNNTATLTEVTEGFIEALQNLSSSFGNGNLFDGTDYFVKAERVKLGVDREYFMEYVSVRSLHDLQHDPKYTAALISMNSDASPAASKTTFHYHPDFMEDLYNGLRFMLTL